MIDIESKIISYREDTDDYRLCLSREEIEEIKMSMTNDAIVSQLLEMNGGVGFDTEDLFNAMNDARADERARVIKELNSYVECMLSVLTAEQMKQVADMMEGLDEQK